MGQLDLFLDTPLHYLEAVRLLGALDPEGCRRELGEHRRALPAAEPDPRRLEGAASWLEARLPAPNLPASEHGAASLSLCRELAAGVAAELHGLGKGTRREAARSLARRALARARGERLGELSPLTPDLPWAVFHLFSGHPEAAQGPLLAFARREGSGAASWLALGDALSAQGRGEEALAAYREGCGQDPGLAAWTPTAPGIETLRRSFAGDPLFSGPWWAVGAYLDGNFPRYWAAQPPLLAARWRRFVSARAEGAAAPVVFFRGLLLSEHGSVLPNEQLQAVRMTLRNLHPSAFAAHRQELEERGPPVARRARGELP